MKKLKTLLSVLIIICLAMSMLAVNVSADITVNGGKGIFIPLASFSKAAGFSFISNTTRQDSKYGTVYCLNMSATAAAMKPNFNFDLSAYAPDAAVGDKVHIKYYIRNVKPDDSYSTSGSFYPYSTYGASSGTPSVNISVTADWQIYEYDTTISSVNNSWRFCSASNTSGQKYAFEIAGVELYYYNSTATQAEINAQLAKSDITSVSIKGTPIDLTQNPTSYETDEEIGISDIAATAYHSNKEVKIEQAQSGSDTLYTLTSYAPDYDLTKTKEDNVGKYTEYKIIAKAKEIEKGKYIPLLSFGKNSGVSEYNFNKTRTDAIFGTVHCLTYTASATTVKPVFYFDRSTYAPDAAVGDKVHIKYYIRYTKPDDTYATNGSFYPYKTYGATSGTPSVNISVTADWQIYEYDTTISAISDDWRFCSTGNVNGKKYSFEIAGVELYYYKSDLNSIEINNQLKQSSFTSVSVKGSSVVLDENPTSYTTEEVLTIDDITATGYFDNKPVSIKQEDSGDKSIFTITSYAPNYNLLTDTGDKSEYTVTASRPIVTLANNDIGYAVIANDGKAELNAPSAEGNAKLSIVTNDDITDSNPFAEYYTWQIEEFENEGTNNLDFIRVNPDSQPGIAPQQDGYVYVSFYYRAYNRFQNNAGATVDGNKWRLYPSVTVGSYDNAYYRPGSTAKYFDAAVDATSGSDIQGWSRISWIQPLEGGEGDMSFKLSAPFTKGEGIISADNKKIDIAQIELIYFGVPGGNTSNQTMIDQKINDALNGFALKSVKVGDNTVSLADCPDLYMEQYELIKPTVEVENLWGKKFVNRVYNSDSGEDNYIVYAPAYDWLNSADEKHTEYLVMLYPAQTFDGFDITSGGASVAENSTFDAGEYEVSFAVTNNAETTFGAVAFVAAYDGNRLVGYGESNVSVDAGDTDSPVTVTVTTTSDADSFKVFVFNNKQDLIPCINAVEF